MTAVSFTSRLFCPRESATSTHRIRGWERPSDGQNTLRQRDISCRCTESNHDSSASSPAAESLPEIHYYSSSPFYRVTYTSITIHQQGWWVKYSTTLLSSRPRAISFNTLEIYCHRRTQNM